MKLHCIFILFCAITFVKCDLSTNTDDSESEDGWSNWSGWSPCSRTCGGGLAIQSRRCQNWQGCKGSSVRYNVCELQDCPEGTLDFHTAQCAELNIEGEEWGPMPMERTCQLLCKSRVRHGKIMKLNARVVDGTRCMNNSGMCVHGHCQKIGCDLILGSDKVVDECGICGGNGSSCAKPIARWTRKFESSCSASCGGGYQILISVCQDASTKDEVPEKYCDEFPKPRPVLTTCGTIACPASWKTEEWRECSSSCGSGYQMREVYCAEMRNSTFIKVADHTCQDTRPIHWRSCDRACPKWHEGIWNECSVTCGDGVQRRQIECRYDDGKPSNECDIRKRPNATRPCRTGITCPIMVPTTSETKPTEETIAESALPESKEKDILESDQIPAEPTFIASDWSECSSKCGQGVQSRTVKCKIFLDFSQTTQVLPDSQCFGKKPKDNRKCFVKQCSPNDQITQTESEKHNQFSNDNIATNDRIQFSSIETSEVLADSYSAEQPSAEKVVQHAKTTFDSDCSQGQCPNKESDIKLIEKSVSDDTNALVYETHNSEEMLYGQTKFYFHEGYLHKNNNTGEPYYWKFFGFTSCSVSCLGGVQESIYNCVQSKDNNEVTVSPSLCKMSERPDTITRTCNDIPCPPRWEVLEFEPCPKSCGGAISKRRVQCIHEVSRSGKGKLIVPNDHCYGKPPNIEQYCNTAPCPPRWVPGTWSKCPKSCRGGYKKREVECMQKVFFKDKPVHPSQCEERKPISRKRCSRRHCNRKHRRRRRKRPTIKAARNQKYLQKVFKKTVNLKIGGTATVFHGANVKIKCPVRRNFDPKRIKWLKDNKLIVGKSNVRITRKSAIKIRRIQYPDEGLYLCKAGSETANITIVVKPMPKSFTSTENSIDVESTIRKLDSKNEVFDSKIKHLGKKLGSVHSDRNLYFPKPYIEHTEENPPIDNKIANDPSDENKPIVYGRLNHNISRLALPKSGINLLSATLAHSGSGFDINGEWSPPLDVYGTVRNETEEFFEPRNSIYYGKVSHGVLVTEQNGTKQKQSIYENQALQEVPSDLQERSAETDSKMLNNFLTKENLHKPLINISRGTSSGKFSLHAPEILGKGNRDSLEFEWKVTNWTTCSQTCSFSGNSGGYQVRSIHCLLNVDNVSRVVDNALCMDAGLSAPDTLQRCGFEECPRWRVGDWSECKKSRCFTLHYAQQRRKVECVLYNGTTANSTECNKVTKPHYKRECYTRDCVGTWKTGNWTKCIAPCSGQGYKTRILQCVWNGTSKPAGNACRNLPRPEVVKWCDADPCPENEIATPKKKIKCKDRSKYCRIVVRINMCKHYKDLCCNSCQ